MCAMQALCVWVATNDPLLHGNNPTFVGHISEHLLVPNQFKGFRKLKKKSKNGSSFENCVIY